MSAGELAGEVLRSLTRHGLADAEVFLKRGRSRRLTLTPRQASSVMCQERAWAVRAGKRRGAFFLAGTGLPRPEGPWPELSGPPLALPEPGSPAAWNEPSDFEAPLIGEREGLQLLESLGRELAAELPQSQLHAATLEDGASEAEIASSRGIDVRVRSRLATLQMAASGPGRAAPIARVYLAAREARHFNSRALARRLADRLAVSASGTSPADALLAGVAGGASKEMELLLAPPVAIRLLAGLLPLLVGPEAPSLHEGLHAPRDFQGARDGREPRDRRPRAARDSGGRLASALLTVIDDGRFPGGPVEAPVDGEGVPTREVVLIESGVFRQPLLAWWQAGRETPGSSSGCSRRPGWGDLPRPGATHLYIRPEPRVSVASLLGSVVRGCYLIDATGPGRFDLAAGRFELPVCGFIIASGRASAPLAAAWLHGPIANLLHGISGVARDLTFQPLQGLLGSPTLLATGLELHPARI